MKGDIKAIERYWMYALVHLQVLYCHPSFETLVEVEWVDDILHYKRNIAGGANNDPTEDEKNFTEENLADGKADLMVYMAIDNTDNANQKDDTIGRAGLGRACNNATWARRTARSVTEWNEHTNYFGGVSFSFSKFLFEKKIFHFAKILIQL